MSTVGQWHEDTVRGHSCYVYLPSRPNPHGFVVLYLHGLHLGKLQGSSEFNEQFERLGLPVCAPITQQSWWTDRICLDFDSEVSAQEHVLDYVLPFISRRWGLESPRIGLFGTSMGGQGALRLAYRFPDRFPVVAAVSPAIDYQVRMAEGDEVLCQMYPNAEAARQDTATLHIHPLNWPRHQFFCCDPTDERWYESSERLQMKLSSLGVPHECDLESTAGGHGFQYYNSMAEKVVEFIGHGLEKERLRIV